MGQQHDQSAQNWHRIFSQPQIAEGRKVFVIVSDALRDTKSPVNY